jgi:hypothetical protein
MNYFFHIYINEMDDMYDIYTYDDDVQIQTHINQQQQQP